MYYLDSMEYSSGAKLWRYFMSLSGVWRAGLWLYDWKAMVEEGMMTWNYVVWTQNKLYDLFDFAAGW